MAMHPQTPTKEERRPTYAILDLFPDQGEWTEAEYLALDTNRIVELNDGELEVHEMPTYLHQLILGRLFLILSRFLSDHPLGKIVFSPLPVRLWRGKFREPDLVFMSAEHSDRMEDDYWGVPDLAVEIISEGSVKRDRETKLAEYAQAGIPEYWIVDPFEKTVEVYQLEDETYRLQANLYEDDALTSPQFIGLEIDLAELFADE